MPASKKHETALKFLAPGTYKGVTIMVFQGIQDHYTSEY